MQAVDSLTGLLIDDFTLVKPEGFTPDSTVKASFQVEIYLPSRMFFSILSLFVWPDTYATMHAKKEQICADALDNANKQEIWRIL